MNRMDWLLLAFNVGVFLFLVRWLWCKLADRLAEARNRPRCQHGVLRVSKCHVCHYMNEQEFAKAEKERNVIDEVGEVPWDKLAPGTYTFDYAQLEKRIFNLYTGPETVWRTQDGRVIPIRRMTDEHLRHTVAMLNRKYLGQHRYTTIRERWPVYGELVDECLRRKLTVEVIS